MKIKIVGLLTGLSLGAGMLSIALLWRYRRIQTEGLAWQKQRRIALDVLACPDCRGALAVASLPKAEGYYCPACKKNYPVVAGIPHFIQPQALTSLNKRFAQMVDWFFWGYRLFSKIAFVYIGMSEKRARREITDRLEPKGGHVLEVSIGPGLNLPYLVGRADVGEIFGSNISLGQLNRFREYVAHQGWDVQLQLGKAEQVPYQDNSFDGVFHLGGINFFNDKKMAIDEMIRVAKPGTRILICDENERGAQAYERFLAGFRRMAGESREVIVPPIDLVPPEMQEVRLFEVWNGWM